MAATNKTKREPVPVADYLATVAHPQRRADADMLLEMFGRLSGEAPYMYGPSIIGFGTYHYHYDSGREGDAPRLAFSPRATSLVLYLQLEDADGQALLARLGKHKTGKCCLYINKLADVDMAVVEDLVRHTIADMDARYPYS